MNAFAVTQKPVINNLVSSIKEYKPLKVYLFGSYAKGEADESSDIDIVIIKETGLGFLERLKEVIRYINVPKSVDALVYTPEEFKKMQDEGNAFVEMILEEGVLIYEGK